MNGLSIIIPIYNVEQYLAKCLDSVIYPQCKNYEIIAVNDGSTDSSGEIAEKYCEKYPGLIRLINKPNGGLSSARNAGIEKAGYDYLAFLDSDDYLSPGAVPEMLDTLEKDYDICFFDFRSVDSEGNELAYKKGTEAEGSFSLRDNPRLLIEPPNAVNKIWRRSLFTDNGISFPPGLWFEDLCTSTRIYLHAEKMIYIPKPWYNYLYRPGSITNSRNTRRNLEMIEVCEIIMDYYRAQGQFENYKDELCYMTAYHDLLTSTTRVNLADKKSPVQQELKEYFLRCFPDYEANPYIQQMPVKYKFLIKLIMGNHYGTLNSVMRLNDKIKR